MARSSALFRANTKNLLEKLGWNQAELARRAGLKPPVVSRVLTGVNDPELDTLDAIAHALGVTSAQLLSDPAAKESKPIVIEPTLDDALEMLRAEVKKSGRGSRLLQAAEPGSNHRRRR